MPLRIAVSQRVIENESYPETRDALAQDWARWLSQVLPDAVMAPVPNRLRDVGEWLDAWDVGAVILSGGNDLGTAADRDATEHRILGWARRCGRPVLAVCRGLQVVNVFFGGRLVREDEGMPDQSHVATQHDVLIVDGAFQKLSGFRTLHVNSYHNEGVIASMLGRNLRVFAMADGDLVEGFVHESEPILAMEWHPERGNPSAEFDLTLTRQLFSKGAFWTS